MIGILIFPDFQLLDAAGPISVFEIAMRYAGARTADQDDRGEAGSGAQFLRRRIAGARLAVACGDHDADRGGRRGGADGGEMRQDAGFRARDGQARRARRQRLLGRLSSSPKPACSTAAAPPRIGGRTRHFLGAYPKVKLEPDRIFIRDGNIWSSAGISAGIDLALAMVAEDFGDEVAQKTARQLVLYHRRSGGQSQFSSLLELKAPTGRFGPLLAWAREHLDAPLTVEDLAEQAGMSTRHFARAFIAETGTTPSKAVERLRIEVARQRVQSSSEAIERVAETTGFRDPERMRRAFIRAFGQPPQSLRRAARAGIG